MKSSEDRIDLSIITCINDIFIYIQSNEEYQKLIKEILSYLGICNLLVFIDIYECYKSEIEFSSYIISNMGINKAQDKV
jgi:hypothetical protein